MGENSLERREPKDDRGGELRGRETRKTEGRKKIEKKKREREGKGEKGRGEKGFLEFVTVLIFCSDVGVFII